MSLIIACARSASLPESAILNLRGSLRLCSWKRKCCGDRVGVGGDVEQLVARTPAKGEAVTLRMVSAQAPTVVMPAWASVALELDGLLDLQVVELHVLAGGDVREAAAPALGDVGQRLELGGGDAAPRDLDALHVLDVRELGVHPHRQAQRAELVGRELAAAEPGDVLRVLVDGGRELALAMLRTWRAAYSPVSARIQCDNGAT